MSGHLLPVLRLLALSLHPLGLLDRGVLERAPGSFFLGPAALGGLQIDLRLPASESYIG